VFRDAAPLPPLRSDHSIAPFGAAAMMPAWCEAAMSPAALAPRGERTENEERALLQRSGVAVAADPAGFAAEFYGRLFHRQPELRSLFPPGFEAQQHKFAHLLVQLLEAVDRPQELGRTLAELGRRHRGYGAKFVHYLAVGEALIETLAARNGESSCARTRLAWARLYSWVVYRMRHAGSESAARPAGRNTLARID
jgi:hemoglobin-like flavoprotein